MKAALQAGCGARSGRGRLGAGRGREKGEWGGGEVESEEGRRCRVSTARLPTGELSVAAPELTLRPPFLLHRYRLLRASE